MQKKIKNTSVSTTQPGKPAVYVQGRLKQTQSGMTLLEVLVSMFVLAIGVLALLATQIRSVAGVREAEGQTIAAQAVQNLIEGMLANPTLSAATADGEATGWTLKAYDAYLRGAASAAACTPDFGAAMTKAQLAAAQLCQFSNSLAAALPEASVQYTVCRDNSDAEPEVSGGNVNFHCSGGGNNFVVKVVWQMDSEETDAGSPLNMNESRVVYSYQARVTQ